MLKDMTAEDYLKVARLSAGRNLFAVGTFERGITLYRQQIRTLNLVYAMVEAKGSDGKSQFNSRSRVGIVGGGAFGVTAAAAAAHAGFNVVLFEQRQALMPLQRGCDTRWIHPRYYEWPAPGSESQLAKLPFLDWQAGTAGQVVTQIEHRFSEIAAQYHQTLHCLLGLTDLKIRIDAQGGFEITYVRPNDQGDIPLDAIICAVGFGIEISSPSYWRNDELSQTRLELLANAKAAFVVSGVGDGGLTDAFRLAINDFRHEQIFSELFGDADRDLITKLRAVQVAAQPFETNWLYDQLSEIAGPVVAEGAFSQICKRLQDRRRIDTSVILNGKEASFRAGLKLGRVSFSNALLAFLLHRTNSISYEGGELNITDPLHPTLQVESGPVKPAPWGKVEYVIRHGTDRVAPFRRLGLHNELASLRAQAASGTDTGKQIFPEGWWSRSSAVGNEVRSPGARPPAPVVYVHPVTVIQGSTFISTLADILRDISEHRGAQGPFRLALHRLALINGTDHFQQITPYAGRIDAPESLGRIFPINGIVGLACRTGTLVVAHEEDKAKFAEIWRLTQFENLDAREIQPYVKALVACPFFAPPIGDGAEHVSLVLFADSGEPNFFNDEVLRLISAASAGFVKNLEELCSKGAIIPISNEYPGYRIRAEETNPLVAKLQGLGVAFDNVHFGQRYKDRMTFKAVHSFDLEALAPRKVQAKLA